MDTEEKEGNKYLILDFRNKNKEVLKKYKQLWVEIKNSIECNSIEKIDNKLSGYGKDFMKIKFNSDDDLPLNKTLKLHNMTIIIRSFFEEDGRYYPQVFLEECLYELWMLEHDRIDISEGIDVQKTNASKEYDITIGILKILVLSASRIFVLVVMV